MTGTLLLILKYIVAGLSFGVAFAGAWFFEYTTTDKDTGRRKLTHWGKRAIVFTVLAAMIAGLSSIVSDLRAMRSADEAQQKLAQSEAATATERANAEQERVEAAKFRNEVLPSIRVLSANLKYLPPRIQDEANKALQRLSGVAAIRRDYPELYSQMVNARSVDDVRKASNEAYVLRTEDRLSKTPACQAFFTRTIDPFSLTARETFPESRSIEITLGPDGVKWDVGDNRAEAGSVGLSRGYVYHFDDGSNLGMQCEGTPLFSSCANNTASGPEAVFTFRELQNKTIASIAYDNKTIDFPPDIAQRLQQKFACVVP
ncbi:hypothetical protein [Phyllobacterium sophorae]|uniref:Uncharacterized protein n=1 Tax=Phyllobacterium sophorae TaxID=1520277 RepID=A0A2P7BFA6_9HYPH|nr:hypothetical protein [Phyllobacterium sophorae]PSH65157.1 hypothetical protein CU103_09040 [Phyllobacterium sophorae]